MNNELIKNLETLATTDYRSRLKLKSVEVVQEDKPDHGIQSSTVKSSPSKTNLTNYIN